MAVLPETNRRFNRPRAFVELDGAVATNRTPRPGRLDQQPRQPDTPPCIDSARGRGPVPPNDWFQDLVVRTLVDLSGEAERRSIDARARELAEFSPGQLAVPPPPRIEVATRTASGSGSPSRSHISRKRAGSRTRVEDSGGLPVTLPRGRRPEHPHHRPAQKRRVIAARGRAERPRLRPGR